MNEATGITVPTVFVVAHDPKHRGEMEGLLARHYSVTAFDDIHAVIGALESQSPDVVVIENDMPPRGGVRMLVTQAGGLPNPPGFLVTANKGEGLNVSFADGPIAGRYLTWPFSGRVLIDQISQLINQSAEQGWESLPEVQSRPLKMTVEEYQKVADSIAAGEPIDYTSASESCSPLIDATKNGAAHALLKSVQSHHDYTYVHSTRVATLLTMFGYGLGMKGDNLLILSTGGLLHDVGKLVTPPEILGKPGKLDDQEWPIMQNHVVESGILLGNSEDIVKGAQIIAEQHHEKIDGTGYPHGLKGSEMNNLARMSSIVDIFGALTDARSYKPAFSAEKSFAILEDMGPSLDQNLLKVFKDIFHSDSEAEAA
jgi:HD-GYP domain-containing protein (c-di-GMP phosphodiesterase class II)